MPTNTLNKNDQVLVTGATGYIGGRLVPILEDLGYSVRCFARNSESLESKVSENTEIIAGDMLNAESISRAMKGVHTAFYLVHSMGSAKSFMDLEKECASNFASAAKSAGVRRIIYLGGLGESSKKLSPHLLSRQEVGAILRESEVPVIELRASVIIGSGSLSFELVRSLVERLPVMITPRWVSTPSQPISIDDVLQYLIESIELPNYEDIIVEIGGAEIMSYGQIMQEYARQRGLKRLMMAVPVLTPRLSSLWLGLVTPVYARIGRKLIDSMRYPSIVNNTTALNYFHVRPSGVTDAISKALSDEDKDVAETRWSDAQSSSGPIKHWGGVRFGPRLLDMRSISVPACRQEAFTPIQCIGGRQGWYYGNWLWQIRGFLDLLVGGVGIRRGRKHPEFINVGDTIDWWRVEAYEPFERLLLIAEMKVPGRAWLEFQISEKGNQTILTQTAIFDPVGVGGLLYWYALYPLHNIVFAGMINNIGRYIREHTQADTQQQEGL